MFALHGFTLLRREASAAGTAITTGLLAVSPLAIHFAMLGRPYALTMLLGAVAVIAFFRWWHVPPAMRVASLAWAGA